jgi:4-hydroxyphenylpyruvate dioxygenase
MGTVSLGGTVVEKIQAIAGAGFHRLELFDDDLRNSGLQPGEVARRCADAGLEIDSYQPFRRAEGVSDNEFRDVLARFRNELAVMAALGTDTILIVSNTDPDAVGDRDHSAGQLAALGAVAAEHGMDILFEALSWGTRINRVTDAWDVLQRAGLPDRRLVVDTFHLRARGDGVTDLAALPDGAVGLLQLADAPLLPLDLLQWSRNHRCFPGEGDFDVFEVSEALFGSGYDGTVSLEIFNPGYRRRPPGEVARQGAQSLRLLTQQPERSAPSGR